MFETLCVDVLTHMSEFLALTDKLTLRVVCVTMDQVMCFSFTTFSLGENTLKTSSRWTTEERKLHREAVQKGWGVPTLAKKLPRVHTLIVYSTRVLPHLHVGWNRLEILKIHIDHLTRKHALCLQQIARFLTLKQVDVVGKKATPAAIRVLTCS